MSPLDKEQFEIAAQAIRNERFEEALALLDTLLSRHPQSAALQWHRSRCLENLDQELEAMDALDRVIALKPNYVPALIARVRHARNEGEAEHFEPLLHQALSYDPENPQALNLLAMIRQENDASPDEVLNLINRSLTRDPKQVEALMMRGELFIAQALQPTDDPLAIRDAMGIVYQRFPLEQALTDFRRANMLNNDVHSLMRFVDTAQKLGLNDEALEQCDITLGRLSADDRYGMRAIEMLRTRVEGGDQAIRDQMASSMEWIHPTQSADRTVEDDIAHSLLQSTADMLRKGKNLDVALDTLVSDSPDDLVATNIARQIYNFAHEVAPGLQAVDAKDYPAYQQNHAKACEKSLVKKGYSVIADAEAKNLSDQMGMRVLVRLFANPAVGTAASFAVKPKWPGALGFALMFVSGQWRTQHMLECKTRLSSGLFLVTRAMGSEPWDTSKMERVQFEKLPPGTSPEKIAAHHEQRVLAALVADPSERIELAHNLDEIEGQWIETNQIKLENRIALDYVTDNELHRILGKQYERFSGKVRERLALMVSD